ncbi:efflux RND transporter permease subunit [Hymenobacter sp. CA2-7]|nr:efflux RND transporter permease subunit [Hymenobacter sp. CA2-7]MDO7885091.1 efflux RND transporter permease subunit [Hymenobacter sp. CA2-7]
MSVGVSVANAVLVITNAATLRLRYRDAVAAARVAGAARLRPILMTSTAMVAGMLPMASARAASKPPPQAAPLSAACWPLWWPRCLSYPLPLPPCSENHFRLDITQPR